MLTFSMKTIQISNFRREVSKTKFTSKSLWVPGGPVVRTLQFCCRVLALVPDQGTKISQDAGHGKKKKFMGFCVRHLLRLLLCQKSSVEYWSRRQIRSLTS